MIDEEKVRLLTRIASYETGSGKKDIVICNYFRSDYISLQLIKSLIHATIAFAVVFALFIFYDFEVFMQDIYRMDLLQFGKSVIIVYLLFLGVYTIISYLVYMYRYAKAKKSLKCYFNNLKKLSHYYEMEGKK